MNNPKHWKYFPENYKELVAHHRKVAPVVPKGDESISKRVGSINRSLATGLTPYSGEWTDVQAAHLAKRTLFGVRKTDLRTALDLGLSGSVDELLKVGVVPAPPVNDYNNAADGIEDPDVPFGETWIHAAHADELEGSRVTSLKAWMVKNRIRQGFSLEEKMILFWHNLLPTEMWGVFIGRASYRYIEMLRTNVFGDYKKLIKDLTLDPSMLLYLNGAWNHKRAPDENYSRELQELFCIGKGKDAGFNEADVQAAARVLTGFTLTWEDVEQAVDLNSFFLPDWHDTGTKQFSAFYNNKTIVGRQGAQGALELDELLDMIFSNEEVSKYICRRLYNFFVYPVIDEITEANVILPLAQIFRDSNYQIKPVLETLLQSEHFFDSANIGSMIKSPADMQIGLWRALDVPDKNDTDIHILYRQHLSMIWTMSTWGMELGDPPSVSGWPAYYQTPQYDKAWITTASITSRAIYSDSLIHWGFWINEDNQQTADLIRFLETLDQPEDPNEMLREAARLLLGILPSEEKFASLKAVLLSGQSTDSYWTNAWNAYQSNSTETNKSILVNRLKPTFQQLLQMGEAQLM